MDTVNERTAFEITAAISTVNGDPPGSVSYRIDDVQSGQSVRSATDLTPGLTVTIPIAPADTEIIDDGNSEEERVVTLTVNDGEVTEYNDEYRYTVKNLRFVS